MDLAKIVKKVPLFQGIDDATVEKLATQCHQKFCTKGCDLFAMGDLANVFFIIIHGWIKLYRSSKDGEEVIVHIFGPGESFAEAAVFGTHKSYPVNAQALEDSVVIEVPRNFFVHKIEQDSRFALRMLGSIAARQHYLVQQLEQVTTRSASQRIGAFLIRFCQKHQLAKEEWMVDLPYDKSIISTRLNIKPETFSRALAKLKPFGVSIKNRVIFISDMKALVDFCDLSLSEVFY